MIEANPLNDRLIGRAKFCEAQGQVKTPALLREAEARIVELEGALCRVVRDVNDYEKANKLSPNPGRSECWDSVAYAKAVLQKT